LSALAVEYLSEQQPLVKDTANVDFGAYFRAFDPAVMDQTLEVFANEPDVGAMLLVMTPQPAMDSLFESIHRVGTELGVPALICNKAGSLVRNQLEAKVMETGYPVYTSLDDCYRVLETLMAYRGFQNEGSRSNGRAPIKKIASTAKNLTPGLLTEPEAKSLLVAAGLPVTREIMASDFDAAVEAAGKIGFPVAIKGVARGLIHKSDADAVRLNISGPVETRRAFSEIKDAIEGNAPDSKFHGCLVTEMVLDGVAEAFVGASWDPQHGAGILVGAGGVFVEILKDVKLAAVPVDQVKARKMIESLKMFPLFDGARGRPRADLNALVDIVCRVSLLAECLGPDLKELDINPVILRREGKGAKVVDARAVWKA
jgi:acetyl-CoA synthetase (ADP-forming)